MMYYYRCTSSSSSSPINNLPVELLSYIFSLSTHTTTTGELSGRLDDKEEAEEEEVVEEHAPPVITTESVRVPLVLSSVCRLWRQVALGTPNLWSSLCITPELIECGERGDDGSETTASLLNTEHVTSYLVRSRKYPLNILIDARDENWSFESELVSDVYNTPLFTSEHMNTVFALLLPHLSRWKSLSILTDCWAPMYTALTAINPFVTRFGAPLLESLSLMRCNDLISFSPQFQPQHLKEPAFLKKSDTTDETDIECMLPSLKHLLLRGVHVDWDALGHSLSTSSSSSSESGLTSLDLAWHSHDVRPSPEQFHQILSSSSGLRSLVLSGSGPTVPPEDSAPSTVAHRGYAPAHLPHLRNITVGYRTAAEGRVALELIDAPNVKELSLEDTSYVGDPDVVNAGPLLSYIGTRQFGGAHQNHRIIACEPTVGYQAALVTDKDLNVQVSCTDVDKAGTTTTTTTTESRAAFPLLEKVTLRDVKTCSEPLRLFLGAQSNLRHLELTRMSMQAIHALLPSDQITNDNDDDDCYKCPCPQLRSLCIKGFEQLDVRDADLIIGGLAAERRNKGACELREVDIHVDATMQQQQQMMMMMPCVPLLPPSPHMKVNIIINDSSDDEDDDDEEDTIMGLDPYEPGGAFNDPLFDAYYSSHFQIAR